uniref:Putative medium chain dehydrogenases/reductase n=1 Tax=uncultured bacterium CSL142 TaxID=1091569 RepID=G4WVN3_9BACT|nr:putative medium chain dehydrogenases/reductase [uncultured bacterium CSL142]
MKCVVLTKYGNTNNLVMAEHPSPTPKSNQILIQVKAAGLNFGDIVIRQGFHKQSPFPPAVYGSEVAGIVREAGSNVTELQRGDRVMAYLPEYGGFAEEVVCDSRLVQMLPEPCSFEEGPCFALIS